MAEGELVSSTVRVSLGEDEVELYRQLIEADERWAEAGFTITSLPWPRGAVLIVHEGLVTGSTSAWARHLALLTAAGMVVAATTSGDGPTTFYLPGDARMRLERAEEAVYRQRGEPTPLSRAEHRISALEQRLAATASRHDGIAEHIGTAVTRGALLLLVVAIAALAIWGILFASVLPSILAVVGMIYAVLTDAWGWTARALAERLGATVARRTHEHLEPRA